jgi:hypothetical protein
LVIFGIKFSLVNHPRLQNGRTIWDSNTVAVVNLKLYVRSNICWVIRRHGPFRAYRYFHRFGLDRNAREKHWGDPAFQMCLDFCERYDQASLGS